jgi:hypothetical protein
LNNISELSGGGCVHKCGEQQGQVRGEERKVLLNHLPVHTFGGAYVLRALSLSTQVDSLWGGNSNSIYPTVAAAKKLVRENNAFSTEPSLLKQLIDVIQHLIEQDRLLFPWKKMPGSFFQVTDRSWMLTCQEALVLLCRLATSRAGIKVDDTSGIIRKNAEFLSSVQGNYICAN